MNDNPLFAQPAALRFVSALFLVFWCVLAIFPLAWVTIMSIRLAVDAFSPNPLKVIFGPTTLALEGGVSTAAIAIVLAALVTAYLVVARHAPALAARLRMGESEVLGWLAASLGIVAALVFIFGLLLPLVTRLVDTVLGALPLFEILARPVFGVTYANYRTVWITDGFHQQFVNTIMITIGVTTISLTVGTLAAYAFSRTLTKFAFWLLIIALIFRAMPHSVLVAGYLPPFINSREILQPLWDNSVVGPIFRLYSEIPPTLYGQPWAVIFVLVAINQPFTIWLLRSFFISIPRELDEAAMVDGCTWFSAFHRVIVPVMWPGVITTGLFSFLLAYNDYLVTAMLLDHQSRTMVPTISQYLNSENNVTDTLRGVAAAVSITAPLFLLVLVFQRQIVAGLIKGAVKG